MSDISGKTYFKIALLVGVLFHGVVVFFTFEKTYDAYVHIFFANHYIENWFDTWEYRWYTGFTMTSYPPLIHQLIALLSLIFGLKGGFIVVAILSCMVFIRGVYVFSKLWVSEKIAGFAALIAVVSSSYVEALHIFGQLPSITGIAVLLNLTPFVYKWIRFKKWIYLLLSLSFFATITSIHHVTTIFGMVFFIFPVIGLALMDNAIEEKGSSLNVRFADFIRHLIKIIIPAILLGGFTGVITLMTILPYWLWSRSDPITQVPIPHGSRDSFIEVFSSGLVFFLIPWGMMLFMLPFLFKKLFTRRTIFLALSFSLAFLLGTGGTTPIPRMMLGETAFNILTLDRFTYWATIMAIPFFGFFIYSLLSGGYKKFIIDRFNKTVYKCTLGFWVIGILLTSGLVINIGYFQPLQPETIEIKPLLNFLERDQHDQWRYLTLGFGDQVAWLSANTKALTVDGNYHSVRRLPELTTREVERLENAKYLGTEGIAALHQFLTMPEKYHLKYIFSNDQFYDPILYFSGWQKLKGLENNIEVWEKPDIPALPTVLPRKDIPRYQQLMWGILPLLSLTILLLLLAIHKKISPGLENTSRGITYRRLDLDEDRHPGLLDFSWTIILFLFIMGLVGFNWHVNKDQYSPSNLLTAYFDAVDYKNFEKAFNLFDPDYAPSIDEMLLDLSREDGITLSYAKLNNLYLKEEYNATGDEAKVKVRAEWITSISSITSNYIYNVHKKDGKWWIKFDERDLKTPPDQIISNPQIDFQNQGKRNIKENSVAHDDILDRPEIVINEANLVMKDEKYFVVGHLTNVDNDPAYITVSATLYDDNNKDIVSYNSREVVIHNLLPKESTYFRIDFEDLAYQISKSNFPSTFDPDFSNPFEFLQKPASFVINVKSTVSSASFYPFLAVSDIISSDTIITGNFVNSGTKECNIPQLLLAYHTDSLLIWVDNQFLERAVRPRRYKYFESSVPDLENIKIQVLGNENNLFTNGQKAGQENQKWKDSYQKSKDELYTVQSPYLADIFPSGYVKQE